MMRMLRLLLLGSITWRCSAIETGETGSSRSRVVPPSLDDFGDANNDRSEDWCHCCVKAKLVSTVPPPSSHLQSSHFPLAKLEAQLEEDVQVEMSSDRNTVS